VSRRFKHHKSMNLGIRIIRQCLDGKLRGCVANLHSTSLRLGQDICGPNTLRRPIDEQSGRRRKKNFVRLPPKNFVADSARDAGVLAEPAPGLLCSSPSPARALVNLFAGITNPDGRALFRRHVVIRKFANDISRVAGRECSKKPFRCRLRGQLGPIVHHRKLLSCPTQGNSQPVDRGTPSRFLKLRREVVSRVGTQGIEGSPKVKDAYGLELAALGACR
jgi:hypothetical protein